MQTKRSKNSTRQRNTVEKIFHDWLSGQPCVITGDYGVHVHHCVGQMFRHNKIQIGHMFCNPLRPDIHREYHAGTKVWRAKYGPQSKYCLRNIYAFQLATGVQVDDDIILAIVDYGQ